MTASVATDLEEIWCRVIQTDSVSPLSNFFLEGGDSRALVALSMEIRSRFGIDLPLTTIFDAQTFGNLRTEVETRLAQR
jgi:acyl carrier protein